MKKDIQPLNHKDQPHGVWIVYYFDGDSIYYTGYWLNGDRIGYWKWFSKDGVVRLKEFFII